MTRWRRIAFPILLVGFAATAVDVKVCDRANGSLCAAVNSNGQVATSAVVSAQTTCHATAAAPSYTEGTDNPISCDLSGATRTSGGGGGGTDVAVHDNGTPTQHLAIDATGKIGINNFPATQPVSGTLTCNQGAAGSAWPVSQSGTWTVQPGNTANTTAWLVTGTGGTFPVTGTVTANQGTANIAANGWPVKWTDGTNTAAVKAASTAPAATDPAGVVSLSPNGNTVAGTVTANQGTANATPWNENVAQFGGTNVSTGTGAGGAGIPRVTVSNDSSILGTKTNNNAAPGATNFGVLPFLANAAVPSWTEGNLVAGSVDLGGAARVVGRPPVVTGAYRAHVTTAQYAGLAADATLISFRYTGTGLCVVTRVRAFVTTQTAATAAGRLDRALYFVRSFTAADSGGTAITLTSPFGKLRGSYAATGLGNLMVSSGGALTKGTGTQDATPLGVMATAGTATQGVGLTLPPPGEDEDLFQYNVGQNLPIQLAQNEGLRISIPTAMPATIAQITAATFEWFEVSSSSNF